MAGIMSLINSEKVFLLFIFLIKIALSATNTCKSENNKQLSNTDCFTDIIKFDQDCYRAGHAIVTKNNELLIEFSLDSDNSIRLFYGLKDNGRNYFDDDSFIKIIDVGDHEGVKNRYESMNRLVKINNGTNNEKEYILSISTYRTIMELYDIDTFTVAIKNSIRYLGHQIFSFQFQTLEATLNNEYVYFCAFSHKDNYEENGLLYGQEEGSKTTLVRFKFSSHDFDSTQVTSVMIEDTKLNDRVISTFIIDELSYIGVILLKHYDNVYKYMIFFYDFDLNKKKVTDNGYIKFYDFSVSNLVGGVGVYFKAIYLTNYYLAFIYSNDVSDTESLKFRLRKLYVNNNINEFSDVITHDFSYELSTSVVFNDFIKYDNERLVFISSKDENNFCIILIYFSDSYSKMKIRYFSYNMNDYHLNKEMSAYFWKDYLLYIPSYYVNSDSSKTTHSFLMIFGFPNGTDFTMDISPHLMDTGYYTFSY